MNREVDNMNANYRYKGVHLKPKIAKAIILEQFAGKTMSRREIDEAVIQYHQLNVGLHQRLKQTLSSSTEIFKRQGIC